MSYLTYGNGKIELIYGKLELKVSLQYLMSAEH
jgi:hypothetical protein